MVNLVEGANEIIKEYLGEENTKDIYLDLVEQCNNNHPTMFVKTMQVYIIRIAQGISNVINTPKMSNTPTYLSALDYLCMKILHDNKLFNSLAGMVQLVDTSSSIDNILIQYNLFIKKLVNATDLPLLRSCLVNKGEVITEQTQTKIYERAKDNKDDKIGQTTIHLDIDNEYKYDPYSKIYQFKLNFSFNDLGEKEYLYLTVLNSYTNKKIIDSVKTKSIKEGSTSFNLDLRDLDIKEAYLSLHITIEKHKEYEMEYKVVDGSETKGFIFKKKVEKFHYEKEKIDDKLGVSSFDISKYISIENNMYGKFKEV
jgi:hypothetical protein